MFTSHMNLFTVTSHYLQQAEQEDHAHGHHDTSHGEWTAAAPASTAAKIHTCHDPQVQAQLHH